MANQPEYRMSGGVLAIIATAETLAFRMIVIRKASNLPINLVDLGCSEGPNMFLAVQNIVDALELKFKHHGLLGPQLPDFHVFFSDISSNDFDKPYTSLSPERKYYATGMPGSFLSRHFPSASLHSVHFSYSIQILSRVPKEVVPLDSQVLANKTFEFLGSCFMDMAKKIDGMEVLPPVLENGTLANAPQYAFRS
ncbi:hypothetical protein FNV43_RR19971 [Rhamnella rubrinervis]|uniref:Uncharacterized protein n=1 Tax=Rhamnella rubrinervis TaxID=2594499 RepID=A0A8K0GU58_9ROSA|nr:hypothetical protein FNV43_RR19971 [Rhamnella rubrinervis]